MDRNKRPLDWTISVFQGTYYLITALWPLLSVDTFQAVTGAKTDLWLVYTVAALIFVIAVSILIGRSDDLTAPGTGQRVFIACGSACALMLCDLIFVARGIISPIYLGDALVEAGIVTCWIGAVRRRNVLN